jgi:hypothetical protein
VIARIVLRNGEEHYAKVGDVGHLMEVIQKVIESSEGPAFFHFDNIMSQPGTILMPGLTPRASTDLIVALDQISHIEVAEENNVPRSL